MIELLKSIYKESGAGGGAQGGKVKSLDQKFNKLASMIVKKKIEMFPMGIEGGSSPEVSPIRQNKTSMNASMFSKK